MQAAGDVFVESGGHAASGGFTVKDDMVFFLEERLCAALELLALSEEDVERTLADVELFAAEAPLSHLGRVERLAPFGMGNPKPVYVLRDVKLQKVSWFGKGEEHLRLTIMRSDAFTDATMEAISFFAKRELGERCTKLVAGSTLTLLGHLERDQFSRGQPARVRIVAIP
jgi:single-stranded DNA-specific DHH superfamily exonuclease